MRRLLLVFITSFAVSLIGCQSLSKMVPGKKGATKGKPAILTQTKKEEEQFRKAVEKDPFPNAASLGL